MTLSFVLDIDYMATKTIPQKATERDCLERQALF